MFSLFKKYKYLIVILFIFISAILVIVSIQKRGRDRNISFLTKNEGGVDTEDTGQKRENNYIVNTDSKTDEGTKEDTPSTNLRYNNSSSEQDSVFQYKETIRGDLSFSRALEDTHRRYPWYSKLPIDNNEYMIIWDIEQQLFKILIKVKSDSDEILKTNLTNKAVADLTRITDGDTRDYEILFLE